MTFPGSQPWGFGRKPSWWNELSRLFSGWFFVHTRRWHSLRFRVSGGSIWVSAELCFSLGKPFRAEPSIPGCRGMEICPVCTCLRPRLKDPRETVLKPPLNSWGWENNSLLAWKPTNWHCSFIPSSPEGLNNSTPGSAAVVVLLQISHLHFPSLFYGSCFSNNSRERTQDPVLTCSISVHWVMHTHAQRLGEELCTACNQLFSSYNVILHSGDRLCFWKKKKKSE